MQATVATKKAKEGKTALKPALKPVKARRASSAPGRANAAPAPSGERHQNEGHGIVAVLVQSQCKIGKGRDCGD